MRTSYSALNTYKTCPLKFKYETIDRIPAPKTKEALFGGLIHKALHFMFKREPLYPSLDEVINFFHQNWEQKREKIEWRENEEEAYKKSALNIIKKFYTANQPWNFHVVDLESRFEVILEDAPKKENHVLAGIIDRIDKLNGEGYEIIDYKTSRKMPPQDRVDQDLQLSIYHLGLIKRWPHLDPGKIKLSLHFLQHNEKISTGRSLESLEKTKELLIKNIREIQERAAKNDFPATPSALCDWCGYRPICPAWRYLYAEEKPSFDNGKIKEIIKEYLALKKQNQTNNKKVAELQKILFGFMEQEKLDRVFADEGYLTKTIRTTISYDLKKAKAILEPLGKWDKTLKVDERKLEKIVAELAPEIREKFKELIVEQKSSLVLTTTRKKIENRK